MSILKAQYTTAEKNFLRPATEGTLIIRRRREHGIKLKVIFLVPLFEIFFLIANFWSPWRIKIEFGKKVFFFNRTFKEKCIGCVTIEIESINIIKGLNDKLSYFSCTYIFRFL